MAVSSKKKSTTKKVSPMGTSCSKNAMGKEIDVIVVGGPKKVVAKKSAPKKTVASKMKSAVKTVKTPAKSTPNTSSKEGAIAKKAKELFEDFKEMNINTEEKIKRFFKLHFGEEGKSSSKKEKGGILKSMENFFGSLFEGDKKKVPTKKKAVAKKATVAKKSTPATKKAMPAKKK